jgi:hypothetical protein
VGVVGPAVTRRLPSGRSAHRAGDLEASESVEECGELGALGMAGSSGGEA